MISMSDPFMLRITFPEPFDVLNRVELSEQLIIVYARDVHMLFNL